MTISNNVGSRFDCHNVLRVLQNNCYHVVQRVGEGSFQLLAVVTTGGMAHQLANGLIDDGAQVLVLKREKNTVWHRSSGVSHLGATFNSLFGVFNANPV